MRAAIAAPVLVAVLLAAACGGDEGAPSAAPADGSTLRATFVDRDGDGTLERGPGEPLRARTDLAPAAAPGARATPRRGRGRR